jgi:hypothetical protein
MTDTFAADTFAAQAVAVLTALDGCDEFPLIRALYQSMPKSWQRTIKQELTALDEKRILALLQEGQELLRRSGVSALRGPLLRRRGDWRCWLRSALSTRESPLALFLGLSHSFHFLSALFEGVLVLCHIDPRVWWSDRNREPKCAEFTPLQETLAEWRADCESH